MNPPANFPTFFGLSLLLWIPLLPILGSLINLTIGRKASNRFIHTVAVGAIGAACALSIYLIASQLWPMFKEWRANGATGTLEIKQVAYTWIEVGSFKVELAFRLDTLSAVMITIVTFVGTLIHIYSTGYMHGEKRYAAYFGYLNLFTGAMLILVLAANLPVMFIGWEGVGLCSFLLIGFWFENEAYATAGRKAFVVNRIGDFAFLLGMFLLYWAVKDKGFAQSLDFGDLHRPEAAGAYVQGFWGGNRLAAAAGILLFIGACGKSAQVPLYVWLPDAMAGPTPVSALIHAATMVTSGVYMICRLSFLYSTSTTALAVVAIVGTVTALMAAFMAMAQTDLKKVLAYSTVSQLGFMFVAAGTGNWVAAIFHLATHAFFKAGLFLGAGSVMHGMDGSGDITLMGGLRKHMPITRITFAIYCLAIAGVPIFSGFFSKDEILAGAFKAMPPDWPAWLGKAIWAALSVAALGTAFYMWRLYFMVFAGEERSEVAKRAHESPLSMTGPLVVLAFLAAFAGLIGFPHLEGTHLPAWTHALSNWLQPSLTHEWYEGTDIEGHASDATTLGLMAVASLLGLLGIGIAWMFYGRGPSPSIARLVDVPGAPLATAHELSKHKLYVDEIYDRVFVRPFRAIARGMFEIVDRFMIDTVLVSGPAWVVGLCARLARWFQNGQLQRYMVGMVVGAAAIFFIGSWKTCPTFDYKQVGDKVELRARPGDGIAGAHARLRWDVDGDGEVDATATMPADGTDSVVTVRAGEVGSEVTLWIDDPITGTTVTVTRVVKLTSGAALPAGPTAAIIQGGR